MGVRIIVMRGKAVMGVVLVLLLLNVQEHDSTAFLAYGRERDRRPMDSLEAENVGSQTLRSRVRDTSVSVPTRLNIGNCIPSH
jgi:hypothetical protein